MDERTNIKQMKKTAVEWLEEKLKENLKHIVINNDYVLMESIFLQAKQMEKEQMEYFGAKCCLMTKQKNQWTLEQLYNELYAKSL